MLNGPEFSRHKLALNTFSQSQVMSFAGHLLEAHYFEFFFTVS